MTVSQEKFYPVRADRRQQAAEYRKAEARNLREKASRLRRRALLATKTGRADAARRMIAEATRLGNRSAHLAAV